MAGFNTVSKVPRGHLPMIAIIGLLTAAMTWPTLVYVFDADVFWLPSESSDIWMKFWDAWYGQMILAGQADFYFTDSLFYPQGLSLVYHNFSIPHMLVFGALQAVMPASNAYCLAHLLIVFATAMAGYVYFHYLFNDKWLGLLGAVIFGFHQHLIGRPSQPDIGFLATAPLSLYCFQRGILERSWKQLVAAGTLVGVTAFIGMYIFVCLVLTLGMVILGFAISRWRKPDFWLGIALLLFVIGAISTLRIVPMVSDPQALEYVLDKHADRGEVGTDLLDYFVHYQHPALTPLLRAVFGATLDGIADTCYLGYLPLALIGLGLFGAASRRKMLPWLILALPFLVLRLGSVLRINDQIFPDIRLPKYYLNDIFPAAFESFHVTTHFQIGILLPLAALSCYGMMTILKSVSARRRPWIILMAVAVIAFEYYYPLQQQFVEAREFAYVEWLDAQENQDAIRLIHLPMGRGRAKVYGFHQTFNGWPHAEGLASRTPLGAYDTIESNLLLSAWRSRSSISCTWSNRGGYLSALDDLADDGFSHVVFHPVFYKDDLAQRIFPDARPSYKDEFAAVYTLADLRGGCP